MEDILHAVASVGKVVFLPVLLLPYWTGCYWTGQALVCFWEITLAAANLAHQ